MHTINTTMLGRTIGRDGAFSSTGVGLLVDDDRRFEAMIAVSSDRLTGNG